MLNKDKVKLGIAPIGWTNDDMPDLGAENTFQQCVSEMALAGFTGCEVGNKYPKDTAVLKKALELRGMQICNAWFSSFLLTKPYEEVEADFIKHITFLKEMGAKVVGISEQSYSIHSYRSHNILYITHSDKIHVVNIHNFNSFTGYTHIYIFAVQIESVLKLFRC